MDEKKEVYIVFTHIKLSCDTDYDYDGFTIVDDSEEVGENISSTELMNYIAKNRDEIIDELKADDTIDLSDVDEIMKFMTDKTEGIMYMYCFQKTSHINSLFECKKDAEDKRDYINSRKGNEAYVSRFDINPTRANLEQKEKSE